MRLLTLIALCSIVAIACAEYRLTLPGLGQVIGTDSEYQKAIMYSGIPFAQAQRWGNPIPPKKWDSINAVSEAPACPQRCGLPPHTCPTVYSEECLYLTVYQPRYVNESSSLPIAVYYHGGNYDMGSGSGELYNAEYLASTGVIYVGVNYRLGLLGFMNSPSLELDGNYGLKDALAALAFVQTYAKQLGGDPSNVSIWGQSAGSMTVAAMLTAPFEKYYYERVLPQYLAMLPKVDVRAYLNDVATVTNAGSLNNALSARKSRDYRFAMLEKVIKESNIKIGKRERKYDGKFVVEQGLFSDYSSKEMYEDIINSDVYSVSNRYFHAAFSISNPFTLPQRTPEEFEGIVSFFSDHLQCSSDGDKAFTSSNEELACLRSKSVDDVLAGQAAARVNMTLHKRPMTAFMPVSPSIHTDLLPTTPYHLIISGASMASMPQAHEKGGISGFPFILGTTSGEGTLFIYEGFGKPVDTFTYAVVLGGLLGLDKIDPVMKVYPPVKKNDTDDQRDVLSTMASDVIFHCSNRNLTLEIEDRIREQISPSESYTSNMWYYVYDQDATFIETAWPGNPNCWTSVCHGSDLPFWYHTGWPKYFNVTQDEEMLSVRMVRHVSQFAKTHVPSWLVNEPSSKKHALSRFLRTRAVDNWPTFASSSRLSLHLTANATQMARPLNNFRHDYCDFLDKVVGYTFADPK